MLAEFAAPESVIVFPAAKGTTTMRFEEILPLAFDMMLKTTASQK
jgi:cytidine deaminase